MINNNFSVLRISLETEETLNQKLTLVKTFGATAGGREDVIKLLKDGHLVGVAPGGGYEAQLATKDYPVMWKQRKVVDITTETSTLCATEFSE